MKTTRISSRSSAAAYNRVTMPKGALVSKRSGDQVAASLGRNMGENPAPRTPPPGPRPLSTFQNALIHIPQITIPSFPTAPFVDVYKQVGQTVSRVIQSVPATFDYTGQAQQRGQQDLTNFYQQQQKQNAKAQGEFVKGSAGSAGFSRGGYAAPAPTGSSNFPRGSAAGGVGQAVENSLVLSQQLESGNFPPVISASQAAMMGVLDNLLALGYTNVSGALRAPGNPTGSTASTAGGTSSGGSGGQNRTIALYGNNGQLYGARGDKWVTSPQAAATYYRRKRKQAQRDYDQSVAQQPVKKNEAGSMQAIGLVDFNVSSG